MGDTMALRLGRPDPAILAVSESFSPIKGYLLGDAMDIPTPKQDVAGWYADDFSGWKKLR